jgi:hypothetical protein
MMEPHKPLTPQQRIIQNRMIKAIDKMSDQQIRDEIIANGEDPKMVADNVRASIETVVTIFFAQRGIMRKRD